MTPKLLTLREAAERLNIPEATLRFWRHQGTGPQGFRMGRRVFFRESDVEAYITQAFEGGDAR